jgi:tetratricopeptide (TPR) repeat protein
MKKINKIILIMIIAFLSINLVKAEINNTKVEEVLSLVLKARQSNLLFDYNNANNYYEKALKLDSKNSNLMQEYLLFSVWQNNYKTALNLANEIVKTDPTHYLANLVIFIKHIKNNDIYLATQTLGKFNLNDSSLNDILLQIAMGVEDVVVKNSNKKFLQATSEISIELEGFDTLHLALLTSLKNPNEALLKLEEVNAKAVSVQSILLYTQLLYKKDKQQAIDYFYDYLADNFLNKYLIEKYLKAAPDIKLATVFSSIFYKISALMPNDINTTFNTTDSLTLVHLALMLDDKNYLANISLASFYNNLGDYERGIIYLKTIPITTYYNRLASLDYIEMLKNTNKIKQLEDYLDSLIKLDPKNPLPYLEKGHLQHKNSSYSNAIKIYTKALDVAKAGNYRLGTWLSYYFRGISYDRNNQWDKAETDFLIAMDINSQDPLLVNYLAYSWIDRDINIEKSLSLLKGILANNLSNYAILDSYAWGLFKTKDYKGALDYINKAYKLNPYDFFVNDHMGDILWKNNKYDLAKNYWSIASNLASNPQMILEINEKLKGNLPLYLQNK